MDKILKVAKRLKIFALEDIVMFTSLDIKIIKEFLENSENIKVFGGKFEYIETMKFEDKFKIIDKNKTLQNSNISVVEACENYIKVRQNKNISQNTINAYRTFLNAHIIPYFKKFKLKDITVNDIEDFRTTMKNKTISERRIKNILTFLNQIIRYFQNEGLIERTCSFEVKKLEKIPKRQIQILSLEQLVQMFKITNKKYPYLAPIIQNMITLKQPLNTILTGNEQQKKSLKRKIRKDFYKIKQEMGLENYIFDDLRFCQKCAD